MSHRYQAPEHVTGIHCPSGNEYRADDKGVVHLKKGPSAADHQALVNAGFEPLDVQAAVAPPKKPAAKKAARKRKPAASKGSASPAVEQKSE